MLDVLNEKMIKLCKKYGNIVLMHENLCVCSELFRHFQDRVVNFGGGSGGNLLAAATGIAVTGKMPVLIMNSDSAFSALKVMKEVISEGNLNIKVIGIGGGDNIDVEAMKLLSNVKVIAPTESMDLLSSLEEVMEQYGPYYLRIVA